MQWRKPSSPNPSEDGPSSLVAVGATGSEEGQGRRDPGRKDGDAPAALWPCSLRNHLNEASVLGWVTCWPHACYPLPTPIVHSPAILGLQVHPCVKPTLDDNLVILRSILGLQGAVIYIYIYYILHIYIYIYGLPTWHYWLRTCLPM